MSCPRCLKEFQCLSQNISKCGCSSITLNSETKVLLEQVYDSCLCNTCLNTLNQLVEQAVVTPHFADFGTQLSSHFYMENGFLVFTEVYHIQKGYCCGNGCRHCPYYVQQV